MHKKAPGGQGFLCGMQSIRREKTKTAPQRVLFLFWLGYRDSNPNIQSQSLLCYRYTISHRVRMIVYQDGKDLSRFFRKFIDKNFYES